MISVVVEIFIHFKILTNVVTVTIVKFKKVIYVVKVNLSAIASLSEKADFRLLANLKYAFFPHLVKSRK